MGGVPRRTVRTEFIILPRWPVPLLLLLLLCAPSAIWRTAMAAEVPLDDVATSCRVDSTVTSGTFDEYYALADVGNRASVRHLVNVSFEVSVRSRQEELAVLLSSEDRSHQYPHFAGSYEMRLTNVYTVLYRETVKLQAYHSPLEKLFPGDRFRLRFLVGRDGTLTVLANDDPARKLLAVVDALPPLEPRYVSFASRMNAYPIRFALGCGLPEDAPDAMVSTTVATAGTASAGCPACPACPKQRCQVVVRACADAGRDTPDGPGEPEQRYYFYFNMYLQKNKTKAAGSAAPVRKLPDLPETS